MPMPWFDGYGFVLRERAFAAVFVLANDRLVGGKIPQPPDFRDGDRGFVPRVFVAFDVHEELLASIWILLLFCHGCAAARLVFHRIHSLFAQSLGDAPHSAYEVRRITRHGLTSPYT